MTTANSAISLIRSDQGRTHQVITDLHCAKVTGADNAGAYSVALVTVPPDCGTPLHRHLPAETFFVLDGELTVLTSDGNPMTAHVGDIIQIPSREPHGYHNTGAATGRYLAILQPADLDGFFAELGTPADGATEPAPLTGPPDLDRLATITAKHNVEMLG